MTSLEVKLGHTWMGDQMMLEEVLESVLIPPTYENPKYLHSIEMLSLLLSVVIQIYPMGRIGLLNPLPRLH